MKVFFHYCPFGFSNCYIVGEDTANGPGQAIIIDPGCMDENILNFIERNKYAVGGVLLTHDHTSHVHGLRTLKRVYDTVVYGGNPSVCEERANLVHDGDRLELGPFSIEAYSVPGHSSDSIVYRIDRLLFTGDVLSAGLVGKTVSAYGRAVQAAAIRNKLFALPGEFIVLPGHGPPSNLDAERRFNAGLMAAEKVAAQRRAVSLDAW